MRGRSRALGGALALLLGLWLGFGSRPASRSVRDVEVGERPAVRGFVRDLEGPLAGARVRFQGDAVRVATDARGNFLLPRSVNSKRRITAWKEGFLIGGAAPNDRLPTLTLRPLPREDNDAYEWVEPGPDSHGTHNCANCHGEIYREWQRSGHARSATGRHFRSLYLGTNWDGKPGVGWGLLDQHPDGAGVCTACHAPTVAVGDPARYDLSKVRGVDARGVHCDYCHKVSGDSGGKVGYTHGRYKLELKRPVEGQLFFGPLDDVDRGEDAYSGFYRESRYCAACHEGVVFGVHVYSTYSEWLDSPAGRQGRHCQDCHMRPTGTMTNIAPSKGGIERDPLTLGNHRFFAGSREEMLRRCLHLSATLRPGPDAVRAEVTVRADGAGHRVPTGFVDRHLLLVVEGLDETGKPLRLRAGPVLPAVAGPELKGRPGKLYAKLLKDFEGNSPAPFWRADPDLVDTRLHPGREDRLVFEFPRELRRLRVRMLYRRFWQEVGRAKGWPDENLVVAEQAFE
ncbi:MAG: hypothetical protein HYS12_10035 [Planctomycetes bacterium]|nr:hypothetical protein [Planctomycetota bacterium]